MHEKLAKILLNLKMRYLGKPGYPCQSQIKITLIFRTRQLSGRFRGSSYKKCSGNLFIFRRIRIQLIFHNIFFILYDLRVTFQNIYSCFEDFDNEDDIFIFSRNVRKSTPSELLFKKQNKNIMKYLLYTNASKKDK